MDKQTTPHMPPNRPASLILFGTFGIALLGATTLLASNMLLPAWILSLLSLAAVTFYFGEVSTGRKSGILIDERNLFSLSRFQLFIWMLLFPSAYIVAVLFNVFSGVSTSLNIEIPATLWWLLGISATTTVVSSLILNTKSSGTADAREIGQTFEILHRRGYEAGTLDAKGRILVKKDISLAHWSDMLTGAEVGNAAHLDITRLQLFVFTLILFMAYAILLCNMFSGDAVAHGIRQLPGLSSSVVILFGISHACFLVGKAIPHSRPSAITE